MSRSVAVEKVQQFCVDIFAAAGVPRPEAKIVADVLVDASLEGLDTHGISRLPIYVSRLLNGRINKQPSIKVERVAPALANLDGDNGLGQLVGVRAMQVAMEMARESGMGFVAVKHSNHYGASSYFCKMAAEQGMVGMAFTNTPPGIPPWGGRKAYFGTNPIAFAFPGQNLPVVVDMSSSTVARGNIILAAKEGRSIPEGWAIDSEGNPTTDAKKALEGAVLPMAGAKGYALALAVEVMSGIITGAAFGPQVGWMYDDSLEPVNIGHSFLAIDIARLMPLEQFTARMQQMIDEIKSVPLAAGFDRIYIPGERRAIKASLRRQQGIPVSDVLQADFDRLADQLGVARLEG